MRQRRAERLQDAAALRVSLRLVLRDADIERLALADGRVERAHGLLERRARVGAVGVEDVDIVEPHALEALVEAGDQIFARAEIAVGPGPHVPAGLGRDDQLVAIGTEVAREDAAEILLGRAVGRPVIVGEIEMGDAAVEGAAEHRAAGLEHVDAAEILPEPQRNGGQVEPAPAGAAVGHALIALRDRRDRSWLAPLGFFRSSAELYDNCTIVRRRETLRAVAILALRQGNPVGDCQPVG